MLEKLTAAEERFRAIEARLSSPDVYEDMASYTALLKEFKSLEPVMQKYREYQAVKKAMEEAENILAHTSDEDMLELANDELRSCKEKLPEVEKALTLMLLPKDPNDEKNIMVEIRSGAGGEEAALFAAVLYRMYSMYAQKRGFRLSLLDANETELGGFKEVVFMVEGAGAYSRFKYESGVHRVQRIPVTESQGRIQTSTVTVAVLPEAEDVEIEINPADLIFESCKSSGAGGQHINKTESAVRLTHKPTGIVVECQEERSQFKNKDKALKMLRTKLFDIKQREHDEKIASDRKNQVGTGDRSERIRTYNYPQGRVSDHRIGLTLYSLDDFLNGNIDTMVDALLTNETAEKLKNAQTI